MRKFTTNILAMTALAAGTVVPLHAPAVAASNPSPTAAVTFNLAMLAPVKGVKKICPDGTRVPFKKACPTPTPDPDPTPDPEPEPDPTVGSISVSDVTVNEGAGTATVTVTKTGTIVGNWEFHYATSNGTASAGSDYTATSGDKSIAAATPSTTFTVSITDDAFDDDGEYINITLSAPSANIAILDGSARVTITDNDDPPAPPPPLPTTMTCPDGSVIPVTQACPVPVFYVQDVTVNEGVGTATVTILKVGSNGEGSFLNCSTSNGTATAGSDYTSTSTTGIHITYLGMQGSFTIPITNDVSVESTETLNVTCTVTSNGQIGDGTGVVSITDNDTTTPPPTPTPPGTAGGDDEPAESLEGYTFRTVTDFTYTDAIQPMVGITHTTGEGAPDVVGAFRMTCGANVDGYYDHVLYFGQDGKSHLHSFNGHKGVNASSTFSTLLGSGGSTCNWQLGANSGKAVQRSSYWIPSFLTGDGSVIRPDYITLYYKREPKSNPVCGMPTGAGSGPMGICTEIPNGLKAVIGSKMVAGSFGPTNINTTNNPAVSYNCHVGGSGKYKTLAALATGAPSCSSMSINARFPRCWDGKYLWKNNRDHLRYQVDYHTDGKLRCETSHPYMVTEVELIYMFNLTGVPKNTMKLASDYMDPTQPRGWSLHADMHIVWDARIKKIFHDNCIDRLLNCSGGDLGNGQQLRGAGQPEYGFSNPNRFVTEPPMPPNMVMP